MLPVSGAEQLSASGAIHGLAPRDLGQRRVLQVRQAGAVLVRAGRNRFHRPRLLGPRPSAPRRSAGYPTALRRVAPARGTALGRIDELVHEREQALAQLDRLLIKREVHDRRPPLSCASRSARASGGTPGRLRARRWTGARRCRSCSRARSASRCRRRGPRSAASFVIRIVNALLSFIGATNSATAWSSSSAGRRRSASPQSAHWMPTAASRSAAAPSVRRSPM